MKVFPPVRINLKCLIKFLCHRDAGRKVFSNPCLLCVSSSIRGWCVEVSLSFLSLHMKLHNSWKVLFSGGVEKLIDAPSARSYFKTCSIRDEVFSLSDTNTQQPPPSGTDWRFSSGLRVWINWIVQEEMFQNLYKTRGPVCQTVSFYSPLKVFQNKIHHLVLN